MAARALVLSLFATATLVSASQPKSRPIPGSYIVEYEDGHDDANSFIASVASHAQVDKHLSFQLFKGASIKLHDAANSKETVAKLANLPNIKNIWQQSMYSLPDFTVLSTGGPETATGHRISRRESNDTIGGEGNTTDSFSPHLMTQIDQLRDEGVTGKGIKVAIIDTGVDYKHPALGGCFGPGCLVSFGYDVVGDNYNGSNEAVPDADPYTSCSGHGTHVAGIIAAQTNNPYGIIGGATGVTLGMFRVYGCNGTTSDAPLIEAYNRAYESGADLITASLGGVGGWGVGPWVETVNRIVAQGVPCLLAAGNSGNQGLYYASNAGDAKLATSIASFDNGLSPSLLKNATYTVDGGQGQIFGSVAGVPPVQSEVTLPLWSVNFDTNDPSNACDALPDDTPDLSGYIVLVRRGTCTFDTKAYNVQAKGGQYIIFYNKDPGAALLETEVPGILGVAMVTAETGASWIDDLKNGHKLSVTMPNPLTTPTYLVNYKNDITGGFVSAYSSWGPTYQGRVKPQFGSPGGSILSTWPLVQGGYATLSGTSMSTPFAAAAYALVMSVRGIKDPATIENLLAATAKPALFNDGITVSNLRAPVPQQGGGIIQVRDAAYTTTFLSVSSLAYNDTDNFVPVQTFDIHNWGQEAITYNLSTHAAATAYTFNASGEIFPSAFPNEMVQSAATLAFDQESFEIPAGAVKTVTVTLTPPDLDPTRLPVYSGYIIIYGSDGSCLSLPYQGVLGSVRSLQTLDEATTYLSNTGHDFNNTYLFDPPKVPSGYTFVLPPVGMENDTSFDDVVDVPYLSINLPWASPLLRADVVSLANGANNSTVVGLQTVGSLVGYPDHWIPRTRFVSYWTGRFNDDSYGSPGQYKIVLRALKTFGDAENENDYDVVETVPFTIEYYDGK